MTASGVLVAGIGNVFLGDDGFGVAVAERLAGAEVPDGVRIGDWGIRGLHLALELLDGCEALVLVDAVPLGEPPGTVVVLEPDVDALVAAGGPVDPHTMSPGVVLRSLASMGGRVGRVLVVGCQPASVEEGMGLSPAVAGAVGPAADRVLALVQELSADRRSGREEICR